MALAALAAGKAVLCEKPLARNLAEARRMLAAARRSGAVHMVCHNYRRIPAVALARQMIQAGELGGAIRHFHARYAQDWLVNPNFPRTWRLQKHLAGSGAHGDINAHIIDLGRYLVGEFQQVCGLLHTFVSERPLANSVTKTPKMGKVTVDDVSMFIGKMENGVLANLEATRFALGRKNHIEIEINGSKGSLYFDFEDMNRLKFFNGDDPKDRQGFRDILVTQGNDVQPYVGNWWPPGHIIGYEHTFIHTVADFVNACADGKPAQPTFEDGLKNQRVLAAVEESVKTGQWAKL
jgi:predicted dehydrogenase